jgi:hypothetical protein
MQAAEESALTNTHTGEQADPDDPNSAFPSQVAD